jgi:hypothetical protein
MHQFPERINDTNHLFLAQNSGILVELCFEHVSGVMGRYKEANVLRWRGLVSEQVVSHHLQTEVVDALQFFAGGVSPMEREAEIVVT